jgi:hypothetical protein
LSSTKRSPSKSPEHLSFKLREDLKAFRNQIVSENDIKKVVCDSLEDRIYDALAEYEYTQPMSFNLGISSFRENTVELSVCTVYDEDADSIRARVGREFSEFLKNAVGIDVDVKVIKVTHAVYVAGPSFIKGEQF